MIPQDQLKKLKPLRDIVNRRNGIKRKQNKFNAKKKHLTRSQRQRAEHPNSRKVGKFSKVNP